MGVFLSLISDCLGSERVRRQDSSDTAATVLSILPLDRLGSILGQIFSTGLKEMMNPDVGKKLVNVLESQAPLLITSMFTNLYTNLRGPVKAPSSNGTVLSSSAPVTSNAGKPLSNSSSALVGALRQPRK